MRREPQSIEKMETLLGGGQSATAAWKGVAHPPSAEVKQIAAGGSHVWAVSAGNAVYHNGARDGSCGREAESRDAAELQPR